MQSTAGQAISQSPSAGGHLTLRKVWSFFWPLALSGIIMSIGQPVVQACLARLSDPELTLAAYSVSLSAGMFLHAPVVMLFATATALVRDERTYRFTRDAMLVCCFAVAAFSAAVTLSPPLFDLMFLRVMGFSPAVAAAARPGLVAMIPWAIPIGVRRYYQGILVRFGGTQVVSIGSAIRLATTIVVVLIGVVVAPAQGVLVGGLAVVAGVTADMLVALVFARRLLMRRVLPAEAEDTAPAGLRAGAFVKFYAPLFMTTTVRQIGRPLMLAAIARSHDPLLALAAFPVALATMQLFSEFTQMLQQVTVAKARDAHSAGVVQRFVLLTAGVATGLLALVALTPLAGFYHGSVIGLKEATLGMANVALRLLVPVVGLASLQAYFSGLLILKGQTLAVNLSAICNMVLMVGGINLLAGATAWPGHLIGGSMFTCGMLIEAALLGRSSWPSVREAWAARSAVQNRGITA